MKSWTCVLVAAGLVASSACRGSGDSSSDVDGGNGDGVNLNDVSIYDLQDPAGVVASGAAVSLKGVIVTAIDDHGANVGNIFVQELEGGAYSGVLVYRAPLGQVAALVVGDVINVEGAVKSEYAPADDTSGRTTTELVRVEGGEISLTKVSSGTPLEPFAVDALAIAQLSTSTARDAEWEKWEGVLIRIQNVSMTTSTREIGGDPEFLEFQVSGQLRVDTSLAAFPTTIARDDCLASITGVGDYYYNYKLLPRVTSEVATGGVGCPPAEEGDALCGNGLDDDYDGFGDCDDFSCQDTAAGCVTTTTIADIQMGVSMGNVSVATAYVTARDDGGSNRGIWVADALAGGAYNGIYVYVGSGSPTVDPAYAIGAQVSVTGTVSELDFSVGVGDTLTQISNPTITVLAAAGNAPTPDASAPITTLNSLASGEAYEGVLVQLSNLEVVASDLTFGRVRMVDTSGNEIQVDNEAHNYTQGSFVMGTCYATITGVMSVFFDATGDIRTINPTGAGDIVTGGTCN
jgi:hypothetical protein